MIKNLIGISSAMLMILLLPCALVHAGEQKTSELNRKMAEISSLQHDLSQRISLAREKQNLMRQKTEDLKEEIKQEKEHLQIESYHDAIKSPRIDFNLKLIQLLFGYISGLNQKILYFQNGYQSLDFYLQQVQDDLLMIKTLNDMEIDKLIAQINLVLDEYIPEISKPIFDTRDVPVKDTKKIWNEIVKRKKPRG
jgi:hypothetical protein